MRVLVVAILFLPILVSGQDISAASKGSKPSFNYYLTLFSQSNGQLAPDLESLNQFKEKISKKKSHFRNEKAFLHHVFIKTHQRYLSRFDEFASFREMLQEGKYNCLTATALYALLLDHLQISYRVMETRYHIFILANTSQGYVLLETTDYENGFIDNPTQITRRMEYYKNQEVEAKQASKKYLEFSFSLLDTVNLNGLLGLLHYNHAVEAYNNKNYQHAIAHLQHAYLLHESKRFHEFAAVLVLTITHSDLSPNVKEKYLQRIEAMQKRKYRLG